MGCVSSIQADTTNCDIEATDIDQIKINDGNTFTVSPESLIQPTSYDNEEMNNYKNVSAFKEKYKSTKQSKYKILIFGGAESGKSTLLKQLRMLYGQKYDKSELLAIKPQLTQNTIEAMRTLAIYSRILSRSRSHNIYISSSPIIANNINLISGYIREQCYDLNIPQCIEKLLHAFIGRIFRESLESIRDRVARISDKQRFTKEHYADFLTLWHSPNIKKMLGYKHQFQLIDTAEYLFSNMHKYWRDEYVPTFQDLLHSYQPTIGVNKIEFVIPNEYRGYEEIYEIYDIGGCKNDIRKWMVFSNNTSAVIFVVTLSGYNQRLWRANKLRQTINLFRGVVNSDIVKNTHFIVFLLEQQEHEDKVEIINLFKQMFENQRRDKMDGRQKTEIHFHVGSATNTLSIEKMFKSCRNNIIEKELQIQAFI